MNREVPHPVGLLLFRRKPRPAADLDLGIRERGETEMLRGDDLIEIGFREP